MLTEVQLAARRTERNMNSRAKLKAKARRHGQMVQDLATFRRKQETWLAGVGDAATKAQIELDIAARAARESRRSVSGVSSPPPRGIFGAVKAFFQRRGR